MAISHRAATTSARRPESRAAAPRACFPGRSGLAADPKLAAPKGEIVVVVGPGAEIAASEDDADRALAEALARLGPADAASEVSKALGLNRRELYRRALELKGVA